MTDFSPTIIPPSGIIGLPTGVKEQGRRVDFKTNDFILAIETKGYRLAWSRMAHCPCVSPNTQTAHPDPTCDLCGGNGWLYFAPTETVAESEVGELDEVQQAIIGQGDVGVIRGIISQAKLNVSMFKETGRWDAAEMMVTVRPENHIGYYDRLINLDSTVPRSERVTVEDPESMLSLRYRAVGINLLRSVAQLYQPGVDFEIVAGRVSWYPGKAPAAATVLVAHYLYHPAWVVTDFPHAIRTTALKFKTSSPKTPRGDPTPLPIQGKVDLDFRVGIPDGD